MTALCQIRQSSHAFCVLAMLATATAAVAQPRADHVVLVSIDGLRPEFYLDESWPAPMLQQMAREGGHADS